MKTMSHSMTDTKEMIIMMILMFIAGLLSSMNMWVDKISDWRFHINDIYMSLLMCGWSLLLMGIYYININYTIIGIIIVAILIYCIRNQIFIDEIQYIKGMIPHHSMAVLMSKKLLEKTHNINDINNINIINEIKKLTNNIINTQENEIKLMKLLLNYKKKNKNA
jgi:hypothetical protein